MPDKSYRRLEISAIPEMEGDKKIDYSDVIKIVNENGQQIAMSKSQFADKIITQQKDFGNFDVNEFKKIFDVIEDIINHLKN